MEKVFDRVKRNRLWKHSTLHEVNKKSVGSITNLQKYIKT